MQSVNAAPTPTSDIPAQWQQGARLPRKPVPRRQQVSAYRFFMLFVFACIVLADVWADLKMPAAVVHVVGLLSVLVWTLTLLGGLEFGPLAVVRKALRSR
ncbi:hypothetical protein [Variovorax sp. RB3P1]|uniref:hypothetical protein n=1 Tax=Variovorax sp. RB3P1 TaxID=3443732 RepID=UPI003F490EE6